KKITTIEAESILRLRRLQVGVTVVRAVIGLALIEVIINQFARAAALPLAVLVATPIFIYFFRVRISRFYSVIEDRFLRNLNAKEIAAIESLAKLPQLAPWNATLVQVDVTADSQ